MWWVIGYSPFLFSGLSFIDLNGFNLGFRELTLFAITLLLSFSLAKPFRQIAVILVILWTLPYLGIPLSFGATGAFAVSSVAAFNKISDSKVGVGNGRILHSTGSRAAFKKTSGHS